MPATEETFRSQRKLHIVFAVTSIGMTLATVWMILNDHLRPWKTVQREFHRVETAKLEVQKAEEQRKLDEQHKRDLTAIDQAIAKAEETESQNARIIAEKKTNSTRFAASSIASTSRSGSPRPTLTARKASTTASSNATNVARRRSSASRRSSRWKRNSIGSRRNARTPLRTEAPRDRDRRAAGQYRPTQEACDERSNATSIASIAS